MTVSLKNNPPFVVPEAAMRRAGFKPGEELEVKASGGVITILPKLPSADDEYTPEQRRVIDARLAEGMADIKAGRTYGPFDTVNDMIAHMKAPLQKKAPSKKTKRSK